MIGPPGNEIAAHRTERLVEAVARELPDAREGKRERTAMAVKIALGKGGR